MSVEITGLSSRRLARWAGFFYLLIIASGISAELFIRASLIVPGDAAATMANILAQPGLFRLGFVADITMLLCDAAIAIVFYLLLSPVHRGWALAAAVFRLMQAAIIGTNLLNYYAPLLLFNSAGFAELFDPAQTSAIAGLFLDLHAHGYDLGLIFFAFSALIMGYLVIQSGYFPRILGYGLWAAALVYLLGSLTRFIFPVFFPSVQMLYAIPLIAELAFALWLLLIGTKAPTRK